MSDKPRPAAWLHSERPDADVITDKVKYVLCGAHGEAPPHTAKYTIPLYTEARIKELEAKLERQEAYYMGERTKTRELGKVAEQYQELLYQVACKFPNETRHETALRYLKERESLARTANQCSKELLGGGEK